jgi:hypothetical protein
MKTKEKIISTAIEQFNKLGYNSLNLFELANILNISRGNLTYHFKDKESLLKAIVSEMWQKIETERSKSRHLPSFENLHNEVQLYFKYQKIYSFIFLSLNMLSHSLIKPKLKEMTNQTITDIKAGIAFSISIGNVKKEAIPGTYNNIAYLTWLITFYWHAQKNICDEKLNIDGEKIIWSLMIPHFTEKGNKSFIDFFGEDYFKDVNQAFDINLSKYITF